MGIIDGQPPSDVRVQCRELRKGGTIRIFGRRLVLQQIIGNESPLIEHGRIPQGIPAVH